MGIIHSIYAVLRRGRAGGARGCLGGWRVLRGGDLVNLAWGATAMTTTTFPWLSGPWENIRACI